MGIFGANREIGPDTVLQRKKDILFNQIDGEVVMLSIEKGEYYGMDKVGSRIWELIEKPTTFNNLIATLLNEFNVELETCVKDTTIFINTLNMKNLLSLS